jgi:hypothetical protein
MVNPYTIKIQDTLIDTVAELLSENVTLIWETSRIV